MTARRFGLSPEQFWGSTIRGLFREFAAVKLARRDQFERDTILAYQAVRVYVMSVTKKGLRMPTIEKVLGAAHKETPTTEQHRSALEMLSQMTGVPLQPKGSKFPAMKWRKPKK